MFPNAQFIDLSDCVPDDPNVEHQVEWTMSPWAVRHGYDLDLGFIPQFLHTDDPRPAAEQIDENYAHGGGWRPNPNAVPFWRISEHDGALLYDDGDGPPEVHQIVATAELRGEQLHLYESAWCAIIQPDGSFAVSRLD
jgi:hypothetical protein